MRFLRRLTHNFEIITPRKLFNFMNEDTIYQVLKKCSINIMVGKL